MYWRRWFEAWKDLQFEIQDVLDAGDDVVVPIRNQRQWGRHWKSAPSCLQMRRYSRWVREK